MVQIYPCGGGGKLGLFDYLRKKGKSFSNHRKKQLSSPVAFSRKSTRKKIFLLVSKSFKPVLGDCDLCPDKKVWCNAYVCGEGNARIFVCERCQAIELSPYQKTDQLIP
jgi:hypothetical protein